MRFCFGTSGLTRSQSSSDTAQDLIALMTQDIMNSFFNTRYYLRISSKSDFMENIFRHRIHLPPNKKRRS
jgi:hypothetical protein